MSETQISKQIVNQLRKTYLTQRSKYLIQKATGEYATCTKSLTMTMLQKHLEQEITVGTFAGTAYTKFICFDIDYKDSQIAKWITYKVAHELEDHGIFDYYVSFSGNKGYHIDIFIDDLIAFDTGRKFFNYIKRRIDVGEYNGDIEFRPTDKLGVKLPLRKHQVTGAYCGYCKIEDGLKVMSKKESLQQLFLIKKIQREQITDILANIGDWKEVFIPEKKKILDAEQALSKHKDLDIYNLTENDIISDAVELLTHGLKYQGTRHNSIVKIASYLKYTGLDKDECIEALNEWMLQQSKKLYSTKLDDCFLDIKRVVEWVYEKDVSVTPTIKEVKITFNEINWIIINCPEKNQKLLLYSMLVHSKRYANMNEVFFMTYRQMSMTTGLNASTTQRQIEKLYELGVIDIVERNRKIKKSHLKRANKYKLNIMIDNDINEEDTYITSKNNDISECMKNYYSEKELRKLLSRKQYNKFIS